MMIVACPSCQARYKFDEARLGDRPRARTRCAKCGGSIEIENPNAPATTQPPGPVAEPVPAPPSRPTEPSTPVQTQAQIRTAVMTRPADGLTPVAGSETMAGKDLHGSGVLELPKDKRFSLAVIQGAATGRIFQITRTRTTIGRSGNDIDLDDPEASRAHALVEVLGDQAILRDLGSTNGTWVDSERIEHQVLANQAEFRIGSHALMFIITDLE